jgi:hypothetical protein
MPEETASSAPAASESSLPAPSQSSASSPVYEHRIGESPAHAQSAEKANGETEPQPAKPKELSRYERTKRQKAVLAQREAALRQKETEFAQRERALSEAQKPKRDYTIAELQKYRGQWEAEGNLELVEAADKEIAAIKAEEEAAKKASTSTVELPVMGTPEHRAQWEAAERELAQADPEFMREGTSLDKRLREIMQSEDGNIYRQHPRGIIAAYHRAKMELLEADVKGLRTELQKKNEELKRYEGLTSIGGGAPSRVGNGQRVESIGDFAKLSTADMRKHLLAKGKREGVPWF